MLYAIPEENESCTWYRDASCCCVAVTRNETAVLLLLQLFKSSLNAALLLHSSNAYGGPVSFHEISYSNWLILEKKSRRSTADTLEAASRDITMLLN